MNKRRINTLGVVFALVVAGSSEAHAQTVLFPTASVLAIDVFSGPEFTVTQNLAPTSLLSISAVGTVDLQVGNFTANAAGVIISPEITNTGNSPGQIAINSLTGRPYAALLIGNSDIGFFTAFPANAANGLGSQNAPTSLSETVPLNQIFNGTGFNGISAGTVLELLVSDFNTADNSGSYSVRISSIAATASPEPGALLLCLPFVGFLCQGIGRTRRRK